MSKRRLIWWLGGAIAYLFVYAGAYAWLALPEANAWSRVLGHLIPIALGPPLAVAAYAFNRRNSYLQALRQLWAGLVPAAQQAIQYTHLSNPTQRDFAATQSAISTAIDEVRGVFANVPAQGAPRGLYPYENLKDIQMAISWLGFDGNFNPHNANQTRACVVRLWQEMHEAMLAEFDRDQPARPVSKYFHSGKSLADLLKEGSLESGDFEVGCRASNPSKRTSLPINP